MDQHALSVSQSGNCQVSYHRTSQPITSFIISFSRANAACSRRYASLSPSARSNGTRCMRDQIFSRCSSLVEKKTETQLHLNQSYFPISVATTHGPILRHDKAKTAMSRGRIPYNATFPVGLDISLDTFLVLHTGSVRTFALPWKSTHLFSMFPFPTR